jgi:hypothetical protein
MATDREMKAHKEEKLYDLVMVKRLFKRGDLKELEMYLKMAEDRTQSGMTIEEIEMVTSRVTRTLEE